MNEMQEIDFSKIDFTEFFNEINQNMNTTSFDQNSQAYENQKLTQLKSIYGNNCQVCSNTDANTFMHIVPLMTVRHARNLNKRRSRKYKRQLPAINNYRLDNLLPVCRKCLMKQFNTSIYQLVETTHLQLIDAVRQKHSYPQLVAAGSIRKLHQLLAKHV